MSNKASQTTAGSYYQQGDVLLNRIDALPEGLVEATGASALVLQHGETTGHMHQFRIQDASNVKVFVRPQPADTSRITPLDTNKYVMVLGNNAVQLFHEEHKPVSVDPGLYSMDIVREWLYDEHEVSRVVD